MSARAIPVAETAPWGNGAQVVTATRRVFPLATVRLSFRGGATSDPDGKEGLSAITIRMLERGTKTRSREKIADEIETLGATLGLSAGHDTVQIATTALSRNLDHVFSILAELILEPTFPEDELEKLRAEMIQELALIREEDRDIGDGFFRRAIYGTRPYGHIVEGTEASLASITRDEIVARWRQVAGSADLIVAAAGDLDAARLQALLDTHLRALPAGERRPPPSTAARTLAGVEVLLVDKPERTQTQIFLGHTAIPARSPDFLPFLVASHGFGGMFTGRLMQEIRVKRGWSYGASSRLEMNRGDGVTGLWTFPSNGDTIACVRLLLDLYSGFQKTGITADELAAAKGHLLNMLAFEVETPEQVVARRVSELLFGLPDDWSERWVDGIQSTTLERANEAAARVVRTDALALTVVCTADLFVREFAALPEIRSIDVVAFDTDRPDTWKRAHG